MTDRELEPIPPAADVVRILLVAGVAAVVIGLLLLEVLLSVGLELAT